MLRKVYSKKFESHAEQSIASILCFHFEVSHLQGIIPIFSREHKAFLSFSIPRQIDFILDTTTVIATRTLRITMGYEYFNGEFHIHQIMYLVFLGNHSTELSYRLLIFIIN